MSNIAGIREGTGTADRSRLVKDASGYMAATYASQVLAFGIGVVTKALLGPADLGIWAVLLATLSFLGLLELGVVQATNKEIAYALSKGDERAAAEYKRVQFSFVTLTALLGSVGLACYAFLHLGTASDALPLGLLAIALLLPFHQIHMGQMTVFWANRYFAATSILIVFETLLAGSIGLLLVWKVGILGQIVSFAAILFVKLGVLAWQARDNPRLRIGFGWHGDAVKHLIRIGAPLQIINLVNVLKLSGTVFLIAHFFNTEAVGVYAFAQSVQNFIYWTPNAFSIVMFPRFQERYAVSHDEASALHSYLVKPIVGLAFFLLPVLISAAYFFVSVLIDHALPAYRASIPVLAVMLLGTFFLSLEHMPGQFLTTANRLWERVSLSALSVLFLAACVAAAIAMDWGLIGLVAALSIANAVTFLVTFTYAYELADGRPSDPWFVAKLIGAFLYTGAVVSAVDHLLPGSGAAWWPDLSLATGKWLLSLMLMLPLFAVAERRLGLVLAVRQLVGARLKLMR
ncbi:MAG: oligosaccharide flippase family protein [Burkholderiales bacterium]|nr:oligosaccharide flippase family protein [Burkholderiales bacterium]